MRRAPALLALILGLLMLARSPASADNRVALVVGNSHYQNVAALENPGNDARLIADTLGKLGFKLVGGRALIDLDRAAFVRALRDFGREIKNADIAVFYYAGHGVQVEGANWLVPVSANVESAADVDYEMIDADLVLKQMQEGRSRLKIVILDACRNNPFGGRGLRDISRGLAQMKAPEGTLIAYATQPGNVAGDGNEGHSPFTVALAKELPRSGQSVVEVFSAVQRDVDRATGGDQQPWLALSPMESDFFLAGVAPKEAVQPTPPVVSPAPPVIAPTPEAEIVFWQSVKDSREAADFQAYLDQYPNGQFARLARNRIAALKATKVALATPPQALARDLPKPNRDMVAGRSTVMRAGPSVRAKALLRVKEGEQVMVTGEAASGWLPVKAGDRDGFILATAIETADAYRERKEKEAKAADEERKKKDLARTDQAPPARSEDERSTRREAALTPAETGPSSRSVDVADPQIDHLRLLLGGSPEQVFPGAHFDYETMAIAGEYKHDVVRYHWSYVPNFPAWRDFLSANGCVSNQSYVAYLYKDRILFRVSVRLYLEPGCNDYQKALEKLESLQIPGIQTLSHTDGGYTVFEFIKPGMAHLVGVFSHS